jgi:hypothetical protein
MKRDMEAHWRPCIVAHAPARAPLPCALAYRSWVGSTATPLVVFALPLSFHLKLRWRDVQRGLYSPRRFRALCVTNTLVGVVGLGVTVTGIYVSVDGSDRCAS